MRYLLFILLMFTGAVSNAQQQIWKTYLHNNNTNVLNYKTIVSDNIYIFAEAEEYQDARFNDDIVISIFKLDFDGNLINSLVVNIDSIADYNSFKISFISNIDNVFLITGTCTRVSLNKNYNYSILYSSNGNIISTKIYELENNKNEYIYLSRLIANNKYLNLYLNNNTSNSKNYSRIYSISNTKIFEDSIGALDFDKIQIIDSSIYTYKTEINNNNVIDLELTKYNLKFDTLSNSIYSTGLALSANTIQKQINNLYYDLNLKQTVLQGQFFGVPNNPLIMGRELDNYFIVIDSTYTFLNTYYYNYTDTNSYSFSSNSSKLISIYNSAYSLSDVRINDSGIKKLLLAKFNGNIKEKYLLREYPLGLTGNNSNPLSVINYYDKILTAVDLMNNLVLFDVYDQSLNKIKSWLDTIDVQSVDARAKSVETINNDVYIFGLGKPSGKNYIGIFVKKINLSTTGIENKSLNQFSPYPNPTQNILHINCTSCSDIKLYDIYGKLLLNEKNTNEINLEGLNTGVYFMNVTEKEDVRNVFKIMKN